MVYFLKLDIFKDLKINKSKIKTFSAVILQFQKFLGKCRILGENTQKK